MPSEESSGASTYIRTGDRARDFDALVLVLDDFLTWYLDVFLLDVDLDLNAVDVGQTSPCAVIERKSRPSIVFLPSNAMD